MPPTNDLLALLSDERWFRELARGLVTDRATAEDLAQEAALTALASSARPDNPRAWLAGIARNLWRDLARSGARRARREESVARPEATEATDELVAEVELRRRVAELVLALDEPERRVLILRFFQGRSLAAVARHEGIAVSTAHERVERGLATLRRRLDREHGGGRGAWAVALVQRFASRTGGISIAGGIGMGIGTKVALGAFGIAGLLCGWALLAPADEKEASRLAGESATPEPGDPRASAHAALALPVDSARVQVLAPLADMPGTAAPRTEALDASLQGRVLDEAGAPLAGVPVGLWDLFAIFADCPTVPSAADGSFALAVPTSSRSPRPLALEPGRATLSATESEGLWTLVLTATSPYAGLVVDEAGLPVGGAAVSVEPSTVYFREHGLLRQLDSAGDWRTRTDDAGRFEIPAAPAGEAVEVRARKSGYAWARLQPARGDEQSLRIVLQRAEDQLALTGVVLDPRGEPLPCARVLLGGAAFTTSDREGRFALSIQPDQEFATGFPDGSLVRWLQTHVTAVALGYAPVQEALFDRDLSAPLVLRLGEALTITGRVLDPRGAPLAGVRVGPRDPTWLATPVDETPPVCGPMSVEGALRESSLGVTTDADGRFVLDQLLPRDYTLAAFDARTATVGGPWSVLAGTHEVVLVLEPEPGTARVAGRLLSVDGVPLVDAMVFPQRSMPGASDELGGFGSVEGTCATDAEGGFEFPSLATAGTSLGFFHESSLLFSVPLAGLHDLEHLEVRAPRLCELQVELTNPGFARNARILDAAGQTLHAVRFGAGEVTALPTLELDRNGRSDVVLLPDSACTLVLLRENAEVLRLPIRLDPERRTVLRP